MKLRVKKNVNWLTSRSIEVKKIGENVAKLETWCYLDPSNFSDVVQKIAPAEVVVVTEAFLYWRNSNPNSIGLCVETDKELLDTGIGAIDIVQ